MTTHSQPKTSQATSPIRTDSPERVLQQISENEGEPDWMCRFRQDCLERFHSLPEPDGPVRTTDVSISIEEAFLNSSGETPNQASTADNIPPSYREKIQRWKEKGVIFTSLQKALKDHPELVKKYFMTQSVQPDRNRFAALHGALWNGGTFAYVPEGVDVEIPLTVYHRNEGGLRHIFLHQLVVAERNASVRFIEGCSAPVDDRTRTSIGCVEVIVGENASVEYNTLQNWSRSTLNILEKNAIVKENGMVEWIEGNVGSMVTRGRPRAELEGSGAVCRHSVLNLATGEQKLYSGANVIHRAPDTMSSICSRSASKSGGFTETRNGVTVYSDSADAYAEVDSEGLMLDRSSRARTMDELDIREQHVTVDSHGTTRNVPPSRIQYMRQRGFPKPTAHRMLLNGFFRPVLDRFPVEYAVELKKQIRTSLSGDR